MTNKPMLSVELLPCPFCGSAPKLPDGYGTQYEIVCDGCGQATSSIQICDLMTIDERAADMFNDYRYGEEFIERAKLAAIESWNNRVGPAAPHQGEKESYEQRLDRQWRAVPVSELTAWVKSNQSSGGIPEVRVNSKAAVPADSPAAVFRVDAIGYRAGVTLEPESPLPPDGTLLYAEQHGSIGLGAGVTVENIGFSSERGRKPYLVFDGDNRLTELNLIDVSLVSKRKTHTVADLENMGVNVEQPAPVAWVTQCHLSGLIEQAEPNEKATNLQFWSDAFPVFRKQPAPVALVMPERVTAEEFGNESMANGWNACLDEVARLNGVTK